jgi:hypothetical protein
MIERFLVAVIAMLIGVVFVNYYPVVTVGAAGVVLIVLILTIRSSKRGSGNNDEKE